MGADVSVAYLGNRLKNQISPNLSRGTVYNCQARGLKHWGYSPQLRSTLDKHISNFDVVHLHSLWLYPGLAASRAALKHKIPYVIRPAGSLDPEALTHKSLSKRLYFRLIEKRILNNASLIHAVSDQERENIDGFHFKPPCKTIPNGIDPTVFSNLPSRSNARSEFNLNGTDKILLFLGRFHSIKGLELLIPMIQDLAPKIPDLKLLLAGPNGTPYAEQFKSRIQELGISSYFRFLGELDEKEKIFAYRAADLLLLPSKSENFGIVVAEALAAETPVVVSRYTPWSIVNQEKAGDWLDLDPKLWSQTIETRLRSKDWMASAGLRGRRLILEKYSWPKIGERMLATYHQVLEAQSKLPQSSEST